MATYNATPAARSPRDDLVVDDGHSRWTRYEGTRSALVERAGIPAAAFDDANRRTKNIWTSQHADRSIEIRRKSPHRFLVYVSYPPAEQAQRETDRTARRKAEQERENARRIIAGWPTEPSAWRESVANAADLFLDCVERDATGRINPGFRLDAETLEAIALHVQAIRGLIETGRVVQDPDGRAEREAALRARVVQADPALGRFLAAAGLHRA